MHRSNISSSYNTTCICSSFLNGVELAKCFHEHLKPASKPRVITPSYNLSIPEVEAGRISMTSRLKSGPILPPKMIILFVFRHF